MEATFYYSTLAKTNTTTWSNITPATKTAKAVRYMNYAGNFVHSDYTVPDEVKNSNGGASAENYIGVSKDTNSATVATPTTANTAFYAVYTEPLKLWYSNGTNSVSKDVTRRMLCNGSKYNNSLSEDEPEKVAHDGANFVAWTYVVDSYASGNRRTPLQTGVNVLYAIYQKAVSITYNANGGEGAPSPTSGSKTYIAKNGGFNTYSPKVKVSETAPTKSLGVFKGWFKEAAATNKLAMPGDQYELANSITFFAGWEDANCSVTNASGTYYYLTLKDAIAKADNTGSTIIIVKDYTETETVTLDKSVTINTNGKTLTSNNAITVSSGKTVTFTGNGKVQRTSGGLITNNGTVTVNGPTLESKDIVINGGTVNVSAGAVNSTGKQSEDYSVGITANTINVSGGKVSGQYAAIRSGGTISITGGTVEGSTYGIVPLANTTLEVNGNVNITGPTAAIASNHSGLNIQIKNGTLSSSNYGINLMNSSSGATVTITGGTITGNKKGIYDQGGGNTFTIGETSKTPATNTPVITGTTDYGIHITKTTSTLNFYSGTIKGKTKGTTRGVDTAYSVADESKVNYTGGLGANGYGAITTTQSGMYVTTLVKPTLTLGPAQNYLNITGNKEVTLTPGGTNYGTLTYSSSNSQIATVDASTGKVTGLKAGTVTITVTEANSGKTATCTVKVDVVKPIWTVTVKSIT